MPLREGDINITMELKAEPPCCKIACFRTLCETNNFCRASGKLGLKIFDDHRGPIMLCTAFLATLSSILILVAVCAMSYNDSTVQNTCWTYGETEDGDKIWVGLNAFVTEINGETRSTGWRSADCGGGDSYCDDCKDVCLESISFAMMNLITSIPKIKGAIERSTPQGDRNCEKNFQLLTATIGFFSSLSALSVYADGCARNLPGEIGPGGGMSIDYELGPGYVCILVATLLLPINFFVNLLMPVPDKSDSSLDAALVDGSGRKESSDSRF